jgi:enoyl-CoA hydratase
MSYVTTTVTDGVALMTIDRPPANAMNVELLAQINEQLETAAADLPRALVIAGAETVFSAGADLKAVPAYGIEDQRRMVTSINAMAIGAYELPCPVGVGSALMEGLEGGAPFGPRAHHGQLPHPRRRAA